MMGLGYCTVMIREWFSTSKEFRQAALRHNPPAELLQDDGRYVRTSLMLTNDVAQMVSSIYDQAPKREAAYVLGRMASGAIMLSGISLIGSDQRLRMYLLDAADGSASELPPRPLEGTEYLERKIRVALKLKPAMWSLAKVMEEEMGLPTDSALRYGFAILQAERTNPELNLSFVDRRGKVAALSHNIPIDIDLSGDV